MDLWLRAPYCEECILSYPFRRDGLPDITQHDWENDIAWKLGEDALVEIRQELAEDPDFAFSCKRCGRSLAPWNGEVVHVVYEHLEERFGIPLYTPGRRNPPAKLRKQIVNLYGNVCFNCGKPGPGLHVDHILPQSKGGDAAFRNLQPLCAACGHQKGDAVPEDVDVYSNMYFTRPPSDGYEGLFW